MARIRYAHVSSPDQDPGIQKVRLAEAGCEIIRTETASGDLGRMVVTVLGMVADMELKFIRGRQRAGQGVPKARIARELGVSRMTVYRALKVMDRL